MLSPSLEYFLEEIYQLSLQSSNLSIRDITEKLNIPLALATKYLKRLKQQGYLQYSRQRGVFLTEQGKQIAQLSIKKNSVLQEFLFIVSNSKDVEKEAEVMEKYLSHETIYALERLTEFMRIEKKSLERFYKFCEEYDLSRSKELSEVGKED